MIFFIKIETVESFHLFLVDLRIIFMNKVFKIISCKSSCKNYFLLFIDFCSASVGIRAGIILSFHYLIRHRITNCQNDLVEIMKIFTTTIKILTD